MRGARTVQIRGKSGAAAGAGGQRASRIATTNPRSYTVRDLTPDLPPDNPGKQLRDFRRRSATDAQTEARASVRPDAPENG